MKLGLLLCDHTPEALTHVAGDYDAMFRRWIDGEWVVYDVQRGEGPRSLDECDAYVSTGSRASVYEDVPWIHGFADLVRRIHSSRKPFLGVCFGHQMMAHALGGRVAKSGGGWEIGARRFQVEQAQDWMRPARDEFSVLMSCQDQVADLPQGATVLAGNRQCPVALYRVGNMLGIQGHPEWTPDYAEVLMSEREERIGTEKVEEARRLLHHPLDNELLARWTGQFFQSVQSKIDPAKFDPPKIDPASIHPR